MLHGMSVAVRRSGKCGWERLGHRNFLDAEAVVRRRDVATAGRRAGKGRTRKGERKKKGRPEYGEYKVKEK